MNSIQVPRALSLIETGSSRPPMPSKRNSAKEIDFPLARLFCRLSLKCDTSRKGQGVFGFAQAAGIV